MQLLLVLFLTALTSALNATRSGALYVAEIDGENTDLDLRVTHNGVVAGFGLSKFIFSNNTVKLSETDQYIKVGKDGLLVMAVDPDFGFDLNNEVNSSFVIRLTYHGKDEFQLCGDNLIGFESECGGERPICINFEDI